MAPLLVITGPTATGKTEVGIRIAGPLDGEIVSADSRQIYRHMDIGTAKPTPSQRQMVPHHLIDFVDPCDRYNAGRFRRDALSAIGDVEARGRLPIVVGGCGLYIRSLLDGLSPIPDVNATVRERIRAEAKSDLAILFKRLQEVDPIIAKRIHPTDRQRIVRGLEIYEVTGEPLSFWQTKPRKGKFEGESVVLGLRMEMSDLYERIEDRAERMVQQGLVEETIRLRNVGYLPENSAVGTFGYREVFAFLEGKIPLAEAVRRIQKESRRYAKRQMTWLRGERRVRWLNASSPNLVSEILSALYGKQETE